jgi:hypothetical protein
VFYTCDRESGILRSSSKQGDSQLARNSSSWGGSVSQKIKQYKPKNLAQAAENKTLAIAALDKGVCLSLTYEGIPRTAEVHTVGTTTAFKQAMSVSQVGDERNTPSVSDWRLFSFDECFDVALTDTPSAAPRPGYKKGSKQFRKIDREI